MFTGLIEEVGIVDAVYPKEHGLRLVIRTSFKDVEVGESIAVNGVCLTALREESAQLFFDISPQTLALTNLGSLTAGTQVNLERAMLSSSRFGGHYVNGHVDTTACIAKITAYDHFQEVVINDFAVFSLKYLVQKGSIALNGVSLTINEVVHDTIKIMLVPHTLLNTTFGMMQVGQRVNVEFDYLTRIVAHQLSMTGQLRSEVLI